MHVDVFGRRANPTSKCLLGYLHCFLSPSSPLLKIIQFMERIKILRSRTPVGSGGLVLL